MVITIRHLLAVLLACVPLGSCDFDFGRSSAEPKGQVIAIVVDHEITKRQLQFELGNAVVSDGTRRKAAEQFALRRIVTRTILADAARAEGLETAPEFVVQRDRMIDSLLARTLEEKIARELPGTTREEAEAYVANNPDIFAERKIFFVDQIKLSRPSNDDLVSELQSLKTFGQIEAVLTKGHIAYRVGTDQIDAAIQPPNIVSAILRLPPEEVFIVTTGNQMMINRLRDSRIVPLRGLGAVQLALKTLRQRNRQVAVSRTVAEIVARGQKTARYNKAYVADGDSKH